MPFFFTISEMNRRVSPGFTLMELLVSIGIIAILAAIIIVAINPRKQISDARNAQRRSDVNTILNAVYQYMVDNEGTPPGGIDSTAREICRLDATDCDEINLKALSGTYIAGIPVDPVADLSGTGTDYFISVDAHDRITISAPNAELGLSISR